MNLRRFENVVNFSVDLGPLLRDSGHYLAASGCVEAVGHGMESSSIRRPTARALMISDVYPNRVGCAMLWRVGTLLNWVAHAFWGFVSQRREAFERCRALPAKKAGQSPALHSEGGQRARWRGLFDGPL